MTEPLKVLDLFSGIGGFSLGLERTGGFKTVAFCEIEEFPRRVLAKHWPGVPIHRDVRELKGADVGAVDVICGGYPCQPFSLAGRRLGAADDRHLWPEMYRLVDELRPSWVIGENVAGHISMGLDVVLSDLDVLNYASRVFIIPACAVGALHRRDRVWIVANSNHTGSGTPESRNNKNRKKGDKGQHKPFSQPCRHCRAFTEIGRQCTAFIFGECDCPKCQGLCECYVPHAASVSKSEQRHEAKALGNQRDARVEFGGSGSRFNESKPSPALADAFSERGRSGHPERKNAEDAWQSSRRAEFGGWGFEPDVGRVAHGVPSRVDRLRGLGNAIVPQIPEIIGRAILDARAA
jgi:DNA (cytosine-5)-methyltransferase 1